MQLTPRKELSEAELEVALENCAQEPIHIPGSIQPYGMLFVVDSHYTIEQVSANTQNWLGQGPENLLGKALTDFLGADQVDTIKHIISERRLQPTQSTMLELNGQAFDVVAHRWGDSIIIEMEIINDMLAPERDFYYDELRAFAVGMRANQSPQDLYEFITAKIREVTQFDRVKLYKFDQDWNGQIIAEARADYMTSYMGMYFPASDIPQQARILYQKNYVRQITDIRYAAVPIVPELHPVTQQPTDMTHSVLRSVSPIHLQYLDNMNVKASMSITIMQDGKMWGLIACHHNDAYHVPYRIRMIAEIMGHMFSAQLSSMEEMVDMSERERRKLILERLSAVLEPKFSLDQILEEKHELAMDAVKADGLAIRTQGQIYQFGSTPDKDAIANLIEWVHNTSPNEIFNTNEAERFFENNAALRHIKGGLLACPLSRVKSDYMIWFRDSVVQQVKWAGKPEKSAEETKAGYRLMPRSSFALWKETVQNRSTPWGREDIETAQNVVQIMLENEKLLADFANAAKSEFLASMSHELRTPMNAIIGIVNILDRDNSLTTEQQEFIHTLRLSSNSLLQLINDLLDIDKIEAKEMGLEEVDCNLAELIEEVRSLMHVRAEEKGVQFNIRCPNREDLYCVIDAMRVKQVLLNLVNNAIKFTERGFVNLVVDFETIAEETYLIFEVSDTGIGIAPQQLEKIFDKFVQADTSISRRYGGSGLGLAITRSLVELMGGHITARSQEGMGSKFIVKLPYTPSDIRPEPTQPLHSKNDESALRPVGHQKKRVLLAEDYQGNIVVALTLLQNMGYDVTVANNGKEAIRLMEKEAFDVILMDVQMPEMDGYTATKLIKKRQEAGEFPPIKIIGMTAHALTGDKQKCLDAGMDDYISKPFDPHHLESLLVQYTE